MADDDNMARVAIGETGLQVTPICFGTSALGDMAATYGYGVDEERAHATIRAIFDGPANFMDTSRIYGQGRSEARIGDVIRERGGLPEGFVLSTKLDRDLETGRFDTDQARRSLEQSLTALGIDRIPLLHLHDAEYVANPNQLTDPGGALDELFIIKEQGLADAVGLASGRVDAMMPLMKKWDFDAIITHNRFTLINRNAEAMIDYAHDRGMAVLNAAPYNSGILVQGAVPEARFAYMPADAGIMATVRQISEICAQHDVPLGAVALQFSLRDARIASTICGVSKPERVQQTLEWARLPIPDQVWQQLEGLAFSRDDPEQQRVYTSD